ncbi:MAG: hypothetical protein NTU62_15305 [Spirochaetes bacterium]|nr:hypothetical protein [Spirochaetota bacterium]
MQSPIATFRFFSLRWLQVIKPGRLTGTRDDVAAVRVKGSEPDRIGRLLSSTGVQDRILAALEASPTVTVTEKAARWEKRGTVEKAETYQQAMDLVVPIVRALKDAAVFGPD